MHGTGTTSGHGSQGSSWPHGYNAIAGGGGGGDNCGGGGGGEYGTPALTPHVFFGGAGGGSGIDACRNVRAGNGGGIVLVRANNLVRESGGMITSDGGRSYNRADGNYHNGYRVNTGFSGGGGAGGSIYITVDDTLTVNGPTVLTRANPGSGESGAVWGVQVGGNGGQGRTRIEYATKRGPGSLGDAPRPYRAGPQRR